MSSMDVDNIVFGCFGCMMGILLLILAAGTLTGIIIGTRHLIMFIKGYYDSEKIQEKMQVKKYDKKHNKRQIVLIDRSVTILFTNGEDVDKVKKLLNNKEKGDN